MGRRPRFQKLFLLPLLAPLLSGCLGKVEGVAPHESAAGSGDSPSTAGASGLGAGGAAPVSSSPLLPARIRRLSKIEYENSAHALVQNPAPVAADFAPDTRQGGYTLNDAQRVDAVIVKQIASAASTLAAQVRQKLDTLAPCSDPATQQDACAKTFIQSFASRAYRRPLGEDESQKLLALFHVGADGATYADGVELVATGVLQSAGFLYLTETGNAATGKEVNLTPYETASAISYLVTAGPPDDALMSAAANGQLATPEQRSAVFSRLVSGGASRERVIQVIQEWLGTDRLADTAKTDPYQEFAGLKSAMQSETKDFVQRLLESKSGTVGELLGANWTVAKEQKLSTFYGGSTDAEGELALSARRGILNQGAFLSVYAHANETGPVLRGVAVARRIACVNVPSPASQMITVVPLVPDPSKTTRQRLNAHVVDPKCASCHNIIDPLGFAFEQYDGMGRTQTQDHGHDIDSHATVTLGKDFDGDYADSNALATALSTSAAVRECFARNIFRASAGRSDAEVQVSEQAFIDYWKTAPAPAPDAAHPTPASAAQGGILEAMRAFVTNPTFTVRRTQ